MVGATVCGSGTRGCVSAQPLAFGGVRIWLSAASRPQGHRPWSLKEPRDALAALPTTGEGRGGEQHSVSPQRNPGFSPGPAEASDWVRGPGRAGLPLASLAWSSQPLSRDVGDCALVFPASGLSPEQDLP